MSQNIQQRQAEFMIAAHQKLFALSEVLAEKHAPSAQAKLYMDLIDEEYDELQKAFATYGDALREDEKLAALADLLDAVCDLSVVMMGLCNSLGLPFHAAFDEVHKSNMNKFVKNDDGTYTILKRTDGKVIKPKDWKKPNIIDILKYYLIRGE
jgi:predicted HAD superfamily Cof-like phosphohydrolase